MYGTLNSKIKRSRPHWLSIINFLLLFSLILIYFLNPGYVFKEDKKSTSGIMDESKTDLALYSPADGTIAKVYIQEGGKVRAGDLLYEIDNAGIIKKIDELKNEIERLNFTQGKSVTNSEIIDLKAPFAGFVSDISIQQGQSLDKGDPLMVVSDPSKMKLLLNFRSIDIQQVKVGQKARVSLWDFMTYVDGKVVYINSKPVYTPSGSAVYPVEIEVENPGGILKGMYGSAEVITPSGDIQSLEGGKFDYVRSTTMRAESGLTVEQVNLRQSQYVNQGEVLLKIRKDAVAQSTDKNSFQLAKLQMQLEALQGQLSGQKVLAPADGIVRNVTIKPGNVVAKGALIGNLYPSNDLVN